MWIPIVLLVYLFLWGCLIHLHKKSKESAKDLRRNPWFIVMSILGILAAVYLVLFIAVLLIFIFAGGLPAAPPGGSSDNYMIGKIILPPK